MLAIIAACLGVETTNTRAVANRGWNSSAPCARARRGRQSTTCRADSCRGTAPGGVTVADGESCEFAATPPGVRGTLLFGLTPAQVMRLESPLHGRPVALALAAHDAAEREPGKVTTAYERT